MTIQAQLANGNPAYARKQGYEVTRPDATPSHVEDAIRRYASHVDLIPRHESPLDFHTFEAVLGYLTSLV